MRARVGQESMVGNTALVAEAVAHGPAMVAHEDQQKAKTHVRQQ
ncbi:hypothetical protein AB0M45_30895 [Nocardia sp. NPDC051787]